MNVKENKSQKVLQASDEQTFLSAIAKKLKGRILFPKKVAAAKKLFQDEEFVTQFRELISKTQNKTVTK